MRRTRVARMEGGGNGGGLGVDGAELRGGRRSGRDGGRGAPGGVDRGRGTGWRGGGRVGTWGEGRMEERAGQVMGSTRGRHRTGGDETGWAGLGQREGWVWGTSGGAPHVEMGARGGQGGVSNAAT